MGDDLDIDALLEAPYIKETGESKSGGENGHDGRSSSKRDRSRERSSKKDKDRDRDRDKDKDKERSSKRRSRSKDRERDRDRADRDRSHRSSRRGSSKDRDRERDRERDRDRGERGGSRRRSRSRDKDRRRRSRSPRDGRDRGGGGDRRSARKSRTPEMQLTPEERDARTIFVMQLSQRVRARDIEEFFSSVGKIRDVRLIICNKTRRFKGIAYVEFKEIDTVALAMGLTGQKLLGIPVIVQPSQAEKNRAASYSSAAAEPANKKPDKGPMRLYVGSLHFNITEEMLRGIFEPFGKIQTITLMVDQETGRSKGFGFVTYTDAENAKKALEQLNGFELAGRPMKVGNVTERSGAAGAAAEAAVGPAGLDNEELDRSGIDLGATGRLALMAKLAEGTGMKLPQAANQALHTAVSQQQQQQQQQAPATGAPTGPPVAAVGPAQQQQQLAAMNPPIATQCFMLSNMFDPATEVNPGWDLEVRDDVIEECNKYGGVHHILVDKTSPTGNVYVKCPTVAGAVSAVNALHGRWFAGKVITAAYVPVLNYHNLFPEAVGATNVLEMRR